MNPFGILQALVASIEGTLQSLDRKRRQESARSRHRFLLFYFVFLLLCVAILIWTIRSLYFTR
jgi:hypothetical protein